MIKNNFFNRPTRQVAQDLLGKLIVRIYRNKKYLGIITETEAYCGPRDKASHASKGRTPRTETMFGPPGRTYIYLIYGMYYCLNIVTAKQGYPAAVLIRSLQAFKPIPLKQKIDLKQLQPLPDNQTNGPGKVCRYLHLNKTHNGLPLTFPLFEGEMPRRGKGGEGGLWLEDHNLKPAKIKKLPRVGVDYAQEYKDKKWRFLALSIFS